MNLNLIKTKKNFSLFSVGVFNYCVAIKVTSYDQIAFINLLNNFDPFALPNDSNKFFTHDDGCVYQTLKQKDCATVGEIKEIDDFLKKIIETNDSSGILCEYLIISGDEDQDYDLNDDTFELKFKRDEELKASGEAYELELVSDFIKKNPYLEYKSEFDQMEAFLNDYEKRHLGYTSEQNLILGIKSFYKAQESGIFMRVKGLRFYPKINYIIAEF